MVVRSLLIDCVAYTTVAVSGYISTFNATMTIVVERKPLDNFKPDYFMIVAAGSICLVLFAALPVNAVPCRNLFFSFVMR